MGNRLLLGAYWGPRRETVAECAARLAEFISRVGHIDQVLARWFRQGGSRMDAANRQAIVPSASELERLLDEGRNRDFSKHVIDELGFHIELWNGMVPCRAARLSVTCGLYAVVPGLGGNCIVLHLPDELGKLGDSRYACNALTACVLAWDPDWAGIFSRAAMTSRNFRPKPFVDWMVYSRKRLSSVPTPSSVTQVGGQGSLIIVQPEPPNAENATEQERVRRIEQLIHQEE